MRFLNTNLCDGAQLRLSPLTVTRFNHELMLVAEAGTAERTEMRARASTGTAERVEMRARASAGTAERVEMRARTSAQLEQPNA